MRVPNNVLLYRCKHCRSYAEPPLDQAFCYCLGSAEWERGQWVADGAPVVTPVDTKMWQCTVTMDVDNFITQNGTYTVDPPVRINAGSWYRATLVGDKVIVEEVPKPV
jgi:hypothetical protein